MPATMCPACWKTIRTSGGVLERHSDGVGALCAMSRRRAPNAEREAALEARAHHTLSLADRVHTEDPQRVWDLLRRTDRRELEEIAMIALAAIPVDLPQSRLLGWVTRLPRAVPA